MSAAAAAMSRGFCAFAADDGDNGHIGDDAFDDGLPGFGSSDEDEGDEQLGSLAPTISACVCWAAGAYRQQLRAPPAETEPSPVADMRGPGWPLELTLRGCEHRPPLDDASVLSRARADTFYLQPVLQAAECAGVVREMDAVAARMGWHDDGTGVKFQTNLPGNEMDNELFSAATRAVVAKAISEVALPLSRRLFGGGAALRVRGDSAALIKYGSAPLEAGAETGAEAARTEPERRRGWGDEGWRLTEAQPPRLEVHRDGATGVTINVLLSPPDGFTAGGTYIEGSSATEGLVVRPETGHAILHHRAMRHAAFPIELGLRYVLVAFLESG